MKCNYSLIYWSYSISMSAIVLKWHRVELCAACLAAFGLISWLQYTHSVHNGRWRYKYIGVNEILHLRWAGESPWLDLYESAILIYMYKETAQNILFWCFYYIVDTFGLIQQKHDLINRPQAVWYVTLFTYALRLVWFACHALSNYSVSSSLWID